MARKYIVAVKPFLGKAVGEEVTLDSRKTKAFRDMIGRRLIDKAQAEAEAALREEEAEEAAAEEEAAKKKASEGDKNPNKPGVKK